MLILKVYSKESPSRCRMSPTNKTHSLMGLFLKTCLNKHNAAAFLQQAKGQHTPPALTTDNMVIRPKRRRNLNEFVFIKQSNLLQQEHIFNLIEEKKHVGNFFMRS